MKAIRLHQNQHKCDFFKKVTVTWLWAVINLDWVINHEIADTFQFNHLQTSYFFFYFDSNGLVRSIPCHQYTYLHSHGQQTERNTNTRQIKKTLTLLLNELILRNFFLRSVVLNSLFCDVILIIILLLFTHFSFLHYFFILFLVCFRFHSISIDHFVFLFFFIRFRKFFLGPPCPHPLSIFILVY